MTLSMEINPDLNPRDLKMAVHSRRPIKMCELQQLCREERWINEDCSSGPEVMEVKLIQLITSRVHLLFSSAASYV